MADIRFSKAVFAGTYWSVIYFFYLGLALDRPSTQLPTY